MPRSLEHCLAVLTSQHNLSNEEALDILQQVSDRAEEMRRAGIPEPERAAARALGDEAEAHAKLDRQAAVNRAVNRFKSPDEIRKELLASLLNAVPPISGPNRFGLGTLLAESRRDRQRASFMAAWQRESASIVERYRRGPE